MHAHHQVESGPQNGFDTRLISLSIEEAAVNKPSDRFSINALRVPQFTLDINVHDLKLLDINKLRHGSGWGRVPTPVF
jgi:hypothetical protein